MFIIRMAVLGFSAVDGLGAPLPVDSMHTLADDDETKHATSQCQVR